VDAIKESGEDFYNLILDIVKERGADNRLYALSRTKIEEAVMWAIKGVTE
jgi:hypothetical protein